MSVALMKWEGPQTVSRAIEAAEGWEGFREGMKVLIKPNAVMGGSPKISCKGITTSPDVIQGAIQALRAHGAGEIVIGEGAVELPTLKLDTAAAYTWSGIRELAEREDVPLVDLNKGPHRRFTLSDGTEIEIAQAVFDADFVVNMPVLKTHNQTTVTICIKNLKGCLSMESKKACHISSDLQAAIAEFNRHIPCHLNIVDALTATEFGPTPTGIENQVREMGLVLAGKDRLECDVVGSFLLGYEAEKVSHIARYAEGTGKSLRLEDVSVVGEDPRSHRMELGWSWDWADDLFRKYSITGVRMPPYGDRLCSGCGFNLFVGILNFCRANRGLESEGVELCSGKDVVPSASARKVVLLGKCAIQRNKGWEGAVKVGGCPPDPTKMTETLTRELAAPHSG